MTERIWLGQFNIVGGQAQEAGPYAAVTQNRSVADAVADLYLALQPGSVDRDHICAEIQETTSRIFGRTQYSVTGNLLLSLGAAHQRLRDWNRSSLPEDWLTIGISCLAVSGSDAFLAQAGESAAYYRHNGRVERLEPLEPDGKIGLGEADTLSPWFSHLSLEQGDAVLLLSSALDARIEPDQIELSLQQEPPDALTELFRQARGLADCGAVLLGVLEDLSVPPPAAALDEPEATPITAGRQAAPLVTERPPRGRPLPEPPIDTPRPRRFPSPLGRNPFRRVRAEHPDDGAGVLRVLGSERERPQPALQRTGRPAAAALLAAAAAPRLDVRLGSHHPSFRNAFRGLEGGQRSWRGPLYGLGALAVLAVALWLGIPALANSGRTQQFQTLINSAQTELTQAQTEPDLSKRRELLTQAQTNADQARQLRPADPRGASDSSSAAGQLTVLDAVYNLPDVPVIADLSDAGLSPSTAVEVASGDRYYVLDVSSGKVFAVANGPSVNPEVVFETGSNVDGIGATQAQHIAWEPPASADDPGTLLILDSSRHLFGLSRGSLRSIPLRGVEQWHASTAMAFSGGNLYVLDAAGGLVWRYAPSNAGFDTDPAPAVASSDIRSATQISVAGGVFLTGEDAHIRRFLDGQETAFKLSGIDRDPVAPGPPLLDPSGRLLYIADRGNSRVIVLQGDGSFTRQLVHARLAGLRGLAVDGPNGRLIGVVGQALVAIPLPN